MTSAQRSYDLEQLPDEAASGTAELPPFELKQQVAERLASHRARRGRPALPAEEHAPLATPHPGRSRSAQIAAAVAQRYAQTPSYRAFLAAEAERSVQQAHAAAEIATINAQAIAIAQQQLLADLEHWNWTADTERASSVSSDAARATASVVSHMVQQNEERMAAAQRAMRDTYSAPVQEVASPSFTVKLYEDVGRMPPAESRRVGGPLPVLADDERAALDEEIAFRHDPYFDERTTPEPIPANLIEFPRQLVAARKARPRRAEGPLLDDGQGAEGTAAQMRIFEVQADQISDVPANDSVTPEWTSIMLGALPIAEQEPLAWGDLSPTLVPQTAPLSLRAMSGLVDGVVVATATAVFAATAIETEALLSRGAMVHMSLPFMAAALSGIFLVLATIYLVLSFSVGDSTLGMRYARIGLCTFGDENPSRKAMRRRILATVLSVIPMGLGFVWACLDEDRLSWHDRMSRMYQRAY